MWILYSVVICFITILSMTKSCGELPVVLNALPEDRNLRPPFAVGTGVPYKCTNGYQESSGTNEAVCISDNGILKWVVPTLRCEPTPCSSPPEMANARRNMTSGVHSFNIGMSVRYLCNRGYVKLQGGTDEAICRLKDGIAQWATPSLKCVAENCDDPGNIENGDKIGRLYTFPNSVSYKCHEGYFFTTDRTVLYCLPGGTWSERKPACEIVKCPELEVPVNGVINSKENTFDSIVKFHCADGFMIQGVKERQCLSNGSWTGQTPKCAVVTCKAFSHLPGGRIVVGANKNNVGDLMIVKCDNGDAITLKCYSEGVWSNPFPSCIVPTVETKITTTTNGPKNNSDRTTDRNYTGIIDMPCSSPGLIDYGHFVGDVKFPTRETVNYTCNEGYKLEGQSSLKCLANGKWDLEELPKCEKRMQLIEIIVGVTFGVALFILICIGAIVFYVKKRKSNVTQNPGVKNKALALDAKHHDEIRYLERDRKFIPVTSL